MMIRTIICLFVFIFTTLVSAQERDFPDEVFVDPVNGKDSQPGTQELPVKSIKRGQEIARKITAKTNFNGTVHLLPGTHRLTEPLVFDVRDNSKNIFGGTAYFAHGSGEVIISGGKEITGWKRVGKLWQTEIPEVREGKWNFRELFVGDERRPRARHPNSGYFRLEKAGEDRRTSFTFKPGELKIWAGVENMEFVLLHDWSISRVKFASIDEATNEAKLAQPVGFPAPHYAMDHFEKQPRYFVENSLDLVDSPGEWFLDIKSGLLSYMPRDDERIEVFTAVAPYLTSLVQASGDKKTGEPVRNLRFEKITFEHCRWDTPAGGYAEGQATKHDPRDGQSKPGAMNMVPAAVTFDVAEYCQLYFCKFRHLGGGGLWFRQECQQGTVSNCKFNDIAGNAIMVGEPFTRAKPTSRSEGTSLMAQNKNGVSRVNRIDDNDVSQCGQLYYGAVGIWVGIAANTIIQNNHVHHLPYTGISMGWKWDAMPTGAEKNIVKDNRIHNVLQVLSDGGGIYTLGRQPGSELRDNTIYNVPTNAGRAESNGIFMDQGSSEILVEGNKIYNIAKSPIRFHQALNIHLKANKLAHADAVPMFRYNKADPKTMTIENNERIGNEKGEWKEETADKR